MTEEKIYPYAVARIRVLERKLLTKQTLIQMADAKTPEDTIRMLTDVGYCSQGTVDPRSFESILSNEIDKAYAEVRSLVPEEKFVDVFLLKNDYHNLKVLIKSEVSGVDGENYLIDGGTIPLEALKKAFVERRLNQFSKTMADAVAETLDIYSRTQNGQLIDITLDKATFRQMLEIAEETENEFVIGYVTKVSDLTNLKSFLRVKNMGKALRDFELVFVQGGKISLNKFDVAFGSDATGSSFKSTDYGKICEHMSSGFTAFEKLCDDFIMDYVKSAKFSALTLEPLVAYIYAKEAEIKSVRIIMTSKINGIDPEIIKERLRDAYV